MMIEIDPNISQNFDICLWCVSMSAFPTTIHWISLSHHNSWGLEQWSLRPLVWHGSLSQEFQGPWRSHGPGDQRGDGLIFCEQCSQQIHGVTVSDFVDVVEFCMELKCWWLTKRCDLGYICIYIYTYMYTYIHNTHMYIHMCIYI